NVPSVWFMCPVALVPWPVTLVCWFIKVATHWNRRAWSICSRIRRTLSRLLFLRVKHALDRLVIERLAKWTEFQFAGRFFSSRQPCPLNRLRCCFQAQKRGLNG